jgi:hypothetical protein
MTPIFKVFVGFDAREAIAFEVFVHSLMTRASVPITIVPLVRSSLRRIYTRSRGPTESTDFSLTRFLVPYLSQYTGHSVFCDCDCLMQADLLDLWLHVLADPTKALWCVQHDYVPKADRKFDGHVQTTYRRKNWSSLMVFANDRCRMLTPDFVNTASGLDLHQFTWLPDEQIGSIPRTWNWLVGEYEPNPDAKLLHFTNGGPYFPDYREGPEAERWWAEYQRMLAPMALPVEMLR